MIVFNKIKFQNTVLFEISFLIDGLDLLVYVPDVPTEILAYFKLWEKKKKK